MTATVKRGSYELGDYILNVPFDRNKKIYQGSSSATEERERLIHYFLNYSQNASWSYLAGKLYYWGYDTALSEARRFIKGVPGM